MPKQVDDMVDCETEDMIEIYDDQQLLSFTIFIWLIS